MQTIRCAAGVLLCCLACAQRPELPGSYEGLKPEQKRLVDDWIERYRKATGSAISSEQAYSAMWVSTRTTFEAVTHALMKTKLTSESGQSLGTALDLVAKVDDVAGKVEGAGGDEQFRVYVQMKPDAYDTLGSVQEFKRSADNTVYHRGFPICFRSPGIPSIQFSLSRDHERADIDVDYHSSKFPAAFVNGHLKSSNSDIQAGNNYNRHVERWAGLGDWWKNFFGLPLRLKDTGESASEAQALKLPPDQGKGSIEQAMDDFLKTWLVDQKPSLAMAYLSPQSFSCLMGGESPQDLDRGIARFKIQQNMREVNAALGRVGSVAEVVQPVLLSLPRIRNAKGEPGRGYSLFEVREDAAAEFECDYRYGVLDPPKNQPEKFGKYYGAAFKLVSGKNRGSTLLMLWTKEHEHARWRIVSFDVEPPGEKRELKGIVKRVKEEPARVSGDGEMLKANEAFLDAWLAKGDFQKALGFVAESCLSCVGLYADEGPKKAASEAEARTRLVEGMQKTRAAIGSASRLDEYLTPVEVLASTVQLVTHPLEKTFTVIGVPDSLFEAADCRKRNSPDLLPVKQDTPHFGNYYATVIRLKNAPDSTLFLAWAKDGGQWKIAAYHLAVP